MTIINGHKLPPLLDQLIEEGKWKHPDDNKLIEELIGGRYETLGGLGLLGFLSPQSMKSETMGLDGMYDGEYTPDDERHFSASKALGLSSSKVTGKAVPDHLLDIDNHISIAVNYEEQSFELDYRYDPENPRVVANFPRTEPDIIWRVIAPDFETFARKLGLIE